MLVFVHVRARTRACRATVIMEHVLFLLKLVIENIIPEDAHQV